MKYVQVSKTLTNRIRYVQENDRIEDARTYCCMKTLLKYLELLLRLSEFMCSKIQKIVKKFRNKTPQNSRPAESFSKQCVNLQMETPLAVSSLLIQDNIPTLSHYFV